MLAVNTTLIVFIHVVNHAGDFVTMIRTPYPDIFATVSTRSVVYHLYPNQFKCYITQPTIRSIFFATQDLAHAMTSFLERPCLTATMSNFPVRFAPTNTYSR